METRLQVYIGTYTDPIVFGTGEVFHGRGEGIYLYEMISDGSSPRLIWKKSGVSNPSYLDLSPSRRFLYAVNELKEYEGAATGTISAFELDNRGGEPRFLNKKPTGGTDPCHVTVDHAGKFAVVSNYSSGSLSVLPILADGSLGNASNIKQHRGSSADPARQSEAHVHSALFDRDHTHIIVSDLGMDELVAYNWNGSSGKLQRNEGLSLKTKPGSGTRLIKFHPSAAYAYVMNELDSSLSVLSWIGDRSSPRELQRISTLPSSFKAANTGADLHVSPSGTFLYASNRGHDSIAVFRINQESGRLATIGHVPSGGRTPRSFALDPSGSILLAANQDSNNIVEFLINAESGMPVATGLELQVPTPVCVRIYEAAGKP